MAKKMKSQGKQKEQPKLQEQATEVLAEVPDEYVFWCHDRKADCGIWSIYSAIRLGLGRTRLGLCFRTVLYQ
jgi:hypothetical protein